MTAHNPPHTAAAHAARRRAAEAALARVTEAITRMRREKIPITVAAVARRAAVSRTFLYDNPTARAAVNGATADLPHQRRQAVDAADEGATWRERALNAEAGLKSANAEILAQRARIAELMGEIRDLTAEWNDEAIGRMTAENASLKQRVRQLTADNRALEERLQGTRSNNRFQDRRIAALEAELAELKFGP